MLSCCVHDYDIIDTHCVTVVIMLIVYLFLFVSVSLFPAFVPLFPLALSPIFFSFSHTLSLPLSLPFLFSSSPPPPSPSFFSSLLPLRLVVVPMLKLITPPIPLLVPPPPPLRSKRLPNLPKASMMTKGFSILM